MNPEPEDKGKALPVPSSISKEELNSLPLLRYEGPIDLLHHDSEIEALLPDLLSEGVIGFDTETRPSFRKGQNFLPSLVQLATRERVVLIRLREPALPPSLCRILEWPGSLKTGIALNQDMTKLRQMTDFTESGVLDLSRVATKLGIQQTGLRSLTGILLEGRISKGAQVTDWSKPRLTQAQISYAATDAWISRELYFALKELPDAKAAFAPFIG